MKTIDVGSSVDVEMPSVVVSKRSSRAFVEHGMEDQAKEQLPLLAKKSTSANHKESKESERGRSSSIDFEARPQLAMDALMSYPGAGTNITPARRSSDAAEELRPSRRESFSDSLDDFQCAAVTLRKNMKVGDIKLQHVDLPTEGEPVNFGMVIPGVYRSSYPQTEDYPFLQKLRLKTVVTLVQKDFPAGYKSFLNENGIKHHVFDMAGTKKEAIPPQTMQSILRLVMNQQNHPLLIHCNHGRHRTGCVVAVVRKLCGWQTTPILEEYKSFAEPKIRDCDLDYISAFDVKEISNLWAREDSRWFGNENRTRITAVSLVAILIWVVSHAKLKNNYPVQQ
jgi:tyrosine-protein phosphatase SIW14